MLSLIKVAPNPNLFNLDNFKSLSIHKKLNNKKQQINILSNLASLYIDQKNYDLAMNKLTEVLAIEKKLGLESGITIGNMGIIYLNKGSFKLAKIYLDSAISISEKINDLLSLQEFDLASNEACLPAAPSHE